MSPFLFGASVRIQFPWVGPRDESTRTKAMASARGSPIRPVVSRVKLPQPGRGQVRLISCPCWCLLIKGFGLFFFFFVATISRRFIGPLMSVFAQKNFWASIRWNEKKCWLATGLHLHWQFVQGRIWLSVLHFGSWRAVSLKGLVCHQRLEHCPSHFFGTCVPTCPDPFVFELVSQIVFELLICMRSSAGILCVWTCFSACLRFVCCEVDPAVPTCFCCCCILPAFGKPCFLITWFFALVECIYNVFLPWYVVGNLETVSGISGFMLDF